jgi:hypothetical protein
MIQQNTDINSKTPQGSTCVDNIWLSPEAKALSTGRIFLSHSAPFTSSSQFSGNAGVIRDNLSSMWIPSGWTWGGLVSDHCPVWIEFDLS